MTEGDDARSFLDAFEATAEAAGWPEEEWAIWLLPLLAGEALAGEALTAATGLPQAARRGYAEVRKAIVDRLGLSPEDYRRRFRAAKLGPDDRPFAFAQQLGDAAGRWLQPGDGAAAAAVVERVVMEQFIEGLPTRTASWVRCHRPAGLTAAITLAEDHLAVYPAGGGSGRHQPRDSRSQGRRRPTGRTQPGPTAFPTQRGALMR